MKKIFALLLLVCTLASSLVACGGSSKLRIGYMAGPTGMGMAKMIHDNDNEKYEFTNFANNTQGAMAKLASGEVDVVCVPTNLAAAYYSQNGGIQVLAVNCLNSLYIVSSKNENITSFDDLNGKTIYTCMSGTPKPVIEYVLRELGISATVATSFDDSNIVEPKDVGALITGGKVDIALLPEPILTSSLLEIQKSGNTDIEYSVDLDVADAWNTINDTPIAMGCIVARADFVKQNKGLINTFLDDYKASIEFINNSENLNSAAEYVLESGVMGAVAAAKKALANLGDNINYIDGADMKATLITFYSAINLAAPDDGFYYI